MHHPKARAFVLIQILYLLNPAKTGLILLDNFLIIRTYPNVVTFHVLLLYLNLLQFCTPFVHAVKYVYIKIAFLLFILS